ncbi:MAG TPA: NADH-quinone oxidoreductase subunit C [Gammaproteobacteria bacterium]
MDAPESPFATLGRSLGEHGPWRRLLADEAAWLRIGDRLVTGQISLLGLWGAPGSVYAALFDGRTAALVSLDCPDGRFPSLARVHAPAQRLERAVRDLVGLEPEGTPDPRPWLDHGRWGTTAPLADERVAVPDAAVADAAAAGGDPPAAGGEAYPFLPAEGEGLHQVPVGPVHAGIIEPGHFRFTVNGETVVRLEQRLGYVHKGIEALMRGADLERAAQLAGRTSGDSTVAYAYAFARAAEGALGVEPPPRAQWLRALLAELERLANHLGDIGAVCNDAAFALMHSHTGILRERVLRAADACFGHRLMRDRVVPGGVACDLDDAGRRTLAGLVAEIRRRFPALIELYDNTASLQDRTVGAGVLTQALAREYAAGGFVGRASGRPFDARRALPYPPYDELRFEVPVLTQGDVDARVRVRIAEVEQSLGIVEQILDLLPAGELRAALPRARDGAAREGIAMVEGFRGDVLVWLELAGDAIRRCHLRDPSWFQWPLLEAAIEGNIVADFPLCNKSFNCSYSGHDL